MNDFNKMFLDAEPIKKSDVVFVESEEQKIKMELESVLKRDKKFQKMKSDAQKNDDKIPDLMEYIYKKHLSDIETISDKYDIGFDDIAKLILT